MQMTRRMHAREHTYKRMSMHTRTQGLQDNWTLSCTHTQHTTHNTQHTHSVPCHSLQLALQPLAKRTQDLETENAFLPQQMSALHQFAIACEKSRGVAAAPYAAPLAVRGSSLEASSYGSEDLDTMIPHRMDPDAHVRTSDAPQTSRSQLQVAAALEELGFSVQSELYCSQSGLSIDICATTLGANATASSHQEQMFTIEVDLWRSIQPVCPNAGELPPDPPKHGWVG